MDEKNYQDYDALDQMAWGLPQGRERTLLREKAVTVADMSNDEAQQYEARINYINDLCEDGSFPEKYLTVFPWLMAYVEKRKDPQDLQTVLWYYKWVVMIMYEYPVLSRVQIENALLDLKKKYNQYGSTDKVYHDYARETYLYLGDYEKSRYHHHLHSGFKKRDKLDDCAACVLNRVTFFHMVAGDMDDAIKQAAPIFTGKKACTHVPKDTYTNFLIYSLLRNRTELANGYAEKLVKELSRSKFGGNFKNIYPLLVYYARLGEITKALRFFEKYFFNAFDTRGLDGKFHFYLGALYLLGKIVKPTVRLKIAQKIPFYNSTSIYDVAMLIKWFDAETDRLAALFNTRNGNTKYSDVKIAILGM
ncbi:MAG: hypothetical protein V4722_09025 [Bacteroidota bacterium]